MSDSKALFLSLGEGKKSTSAVGCTAGGGEGTGPVWVLLTPVLASEWPWVCLGCPICMLGITLPALPASLDVYKERERW